MTHAESHDLLLDLAYGELDAARAAEVEQHLSSCPECRKEKAALEEARRMAAPVRELEEPPQGFDDRILRAARAQAQLEHDGNVGQVIEVMGTVRPLGVDVARIDAHGPVKARPADRRRPRWIVRTAVAGSVAAAAALSLVVSNTLETRRIAEKAAAARSADFEIRVQQPAPQAVGSALREAEGKQRQKDELDASGLQAGPAPASPQEKTRDSVAQMPALRKRTASGARMQGSGGDATDLKAKAAANANAAANAQPKERTPADETPPQTRAIGGSAEKLSERYSEPPPVASPHRAAEQPPASSAVAARPDMPRAAATMKAQPQVVASAASPALGASAVEANAQQARHAGNYLVAASLYREAAAMRQRDNDLGIAAWNLAHAVECLSAAGHFDEARKVREELASSYPSETTAISAAARALREVDAPAASAPQR